MTNLNNQLFVFLYDEPKSVEKSVEKKLSCILCVCFFYGDRKHVEKICGKKKSERKGIIASVVLKYFLDTFIRAITNLLPPYTAFVEARVPLPFLCCRACLTWSHRLATSLPSFLSPSDLLNLLPHLLALLPYFPCSVARFSSSLTHSLAHFS